MGKVYAGKMIDGEFGVSNGRAYAGKMLGAPTLVPSVANVQRAAGADHVYAFEFGPDWLKDTGSSPVDLTLQGFVDNYEPTIEGTDGIVRVYSQSTAFNSLYADGINVARTEDIYYEAIIDKIVNAANGTYAYFLVGTQTTHAAAHSILARTGDMFARIAVSSSQTYLPIANTAISPEDIEINTFSGEAHYVGAFWDHASSRFRTYVKKAGTPEQETSSGIQAAGSAGLSRITLGGDSVNGFVPDLFRCHNFSIKRGTLTSAHRQKIYDAAGLT